MSSIMLDMDNTIKRMKEIITHYREIKKKMRGKSVNASHRKLMFHVKQNTLEELETLIMRL